MFDINVLQNKIDALKDSFESGEFGDALIGALNTGNGIMQQRIFTQNTDVQGGSFGAYVGAKNKARLKRSANRTQDKRLKALAGQLLTPYQRKRAAKGRQVLKKDLEFTGGLRRSIHTVVENEHSAILEFNNVRAAIIAHGQEQQIRRIRGGIGAKIFRLNTQEREAVIEQGGLLIQQVLKRNRTK